MHPDLGGDNERAAAINEAYAVLMEPDHRAAYDKSRGPNKNDAGFATSGQQQEYHRTEPAVRCAFCRTPMNSVAQGAGNHDVDDDFCSNCSSPLFMAAAVQDEEGDRRSILRVPKDTPLVLCTHWPQQEPYFGRTDDISLNGMRFRCTPGLAIDQIIKLDTQILRAVAQVTRVERGSNYWDVGVKFLTLYFEQSRGSFIRDRV